MPRRLVPVILVIMLALASCTNAPSAPTAPTPTPEGPSQTPAEAERDRVPEKVAALTLSERTAWEMHSPSITSDDGVWSLARTGVVDDYGEVLLLDAKRERVLKAFPLPHAPPHYLRLTPAAVFCGRVGDGGLPDSMVCRIDRSTKDMVVRVYPYDPAQATYYPEGWTIADGYLEMYDLNADEGGLWSRNYKRTWTRLDPKTLQVVATNVARPAATPSSTDG